jgi:hypothetical protein
MNLAVQDSFKKWGVAVFGFRSRGPLERLFLGVTEAFGAFLRLGGVMIALGGVGRLQSRFSAVVG